MNRTLNSSLRMLAIALTLLPVLAFSQPGTAASAALAAASAPAKLKPTPGGTKCGEAGIGKARVDGAWVVQARASAPHQRVSRRGYWQECDTQPTCAEMLVTEPWGPGGRCKPWPGSMLQAQTLGGASVVRATGSDPRNRQSWRCERAASGAASAAVFKPHYAVCH